MKNKLKILLEQIIDMIINLTDRISINRLQENMQLVNAQAKCPVTIQVTQEQPFNPVSGIMELSDCQANAVTLQRINQINHDPAIYPALCHEVVKGGILNYFSIIADDPYFDIGRLVLNAIYNENRYLSVRNEDYIPINETDTSITIPLKYKLTSNGLVLYYDLGRLNDEQKQYFSFFWSKVKVKPFYLSIKNKYAFADLQIQMKSTILAVKII